MYREKIDRFIDAHRNEMLEDIRALVAIDSARGPEKPGMPYGEGCVRALKEALHLGECYGFSVRNYDNYVGTIDLNEKESQLDILAHLDVVPGGDGWNVTMPFEPMEKGGRIYGRGTADDKGPAVAALYAMRAVRELGIPLKKNVRLILGTDEECGSGDIAYYYGIEKEAPMTFSPDAQYPVINLEKGLFQCNFSAEFAESTALPRMVSLESGTKVNVVPATAKAVFEGLKAGECQTLAKAMEAELGVRFEVTEEKGLVRIAALGENGHASTPWKGKNALTGLLSLIESLPLAECEQMKRVGALGRLMPHGDWYGKALGIAMEDAESGPLTITFSMLSVDGKGLKGAFDSRCPLCSNEENTLQAVKRTMAECGLCVHTDSMIPPHHVPGDSAFVKALLCAYECYTGQKGECLSLGGLTYVHELKNGVAFGASMPGTENHMHGPDEFAEISELLTSAKMFAQVIVTLCG